MCGSYRSCTYMGCSFPDSFVHGRTLLHDLNKWNIDQKMPADFSDFY